MNKITICFALLTCFLFPSCKKHYTCSCNVNSTHYNYSYNDLHSEVEETCKEQDAAVKLVDTTGNGGCKLSKD